MTVITAQYKNFVSPPGPFTLVTVGDPSGTQVIPDQVAQVDSAADRTVLPQSCVDRLGLAPIRHIQLAGFGGTPHSYPVFLVLLALPNFSAITLEVVAHPDEPWVLLGRDVMNRYKVLLDGPSLEVSILEP